MNPIAKKKEEKFDAYKLKLIQYKNAANYIMTGLSHSSMLVQGSPTHNCQLMSIASVNCLFFGAFTYISDLDRLRILDYLFMQGLKRTAIIDLNISYRKKIKKLFIDGTYKNAFTLNRAYTNANSSKMCMMIMTHEGVKRAIRAHEIRAKLDKAKKKK